MANFILLMIFYEPIYLFYFILVVLRKYISTKMTKVILELEFFKGKK